MQTLTRKPIPHSKILVYTDTRREINANNSKQKPKPIQQFSNLLYNKEKPLPNPQAIPQQQIKQSIKSSRKQQISALSKPKSKPNLK